MELSISKANTFIQCEMRYYLERVQHWKLAVEPPWFKYGTAVDDLLAVVDTEGLEVARTKIKDYYPNDEYTQVDIDYLLTLYIMKYIGEPFKPVVLDGQDGNQFKIYQDLGEDVILHGYVDKVHEYNTQIGFTERKTTSEAINETSVYWDKLYLDPQIRAYAMGLTEANIEPVNLCNYEVLRKPNKKISVMFDRSRAETIAEYKERVGSLLTKPPKQTMIARKKVFITSDSVKWWKDDHLNTAERMRHCEEKSRTKGERAYRRNHNSCDSYGGCPFRMYCSGKCDLEQIDFIKQVEE